MGRPKPCDCKELRGPWWQEKALPARMPGGTRKREGQYAASPYLSRYCGLRGAEADL
jgi:hypothetical protein